MKSINKLASALMILNLSYGFASPLEIACPGIQRDIQNIKIHGKDGHEVPFPKQARVDIPVSDMMGFWAQTDFEVPGYFYINRNSNNPNLIKIEYWDIEKKKILAQGFACIFEKQKSLSAKMQGPQMNFILTLQAFNNHQISKVYSGSRYSHNYNQDLAIISSLEPLIPNSDETKIQSFIIKKTKH